MIEPSAGDVRKYLDSHGFGFQYALLRRAEALANERRTVWRFEAAEFPVAAASVPIHIDFVMKAAQASVYLVAECKRADPARARWCFIRAPYTRRNGSESDLVFQQVSLGSNFIELSPRVKSASIPNCQLGFELKTGEAGDGRGGVQALNDAVTQVLRGMNGLIKSLFDERRVEASGRPVVVPVIFTTASLYVCDGDLAEADLATGRLSSDWGALKRVDWLWYTYNQSPAIALQQRVAAPYEWGLSEALHAEYARSIAVVGPSGIDAFLAFDMPMWL